jgi:hypothetical protein
LSMKCNHSLVFNVVAALAVYDDVVNSLPNDFAVVFVCGQESGMKDYCGERLMRALHVTIRAARGLGSVQSQARFLGYAELSKRDIQDLQRTIE